MTVPEQSHSRDSKVTSRSTRSSSRTGRTRCCTGSRSTSSRAPASRWWASRVTASRRWRGCSRALAEATSNTDGRTEVLIEQALDRLLKGRPSIIIAHRLSTVRRADEILVIENGQVIQRGSERELLAVDGPFRRLAHALEGGESDLAVAG